LRAVFVLAQTAAVGSSALAAQTRDPWMITLRRAGPVWFGMSIKQAEAALGARFEGETGEDCSYVRALGMPTGLRFMVKGRRIVRVDVDSTRIPTRSGVTVGMTEAQVRQL
jgi:hypothetical protein